MECISVTMWGLRVGAAAWDLGCELCWGGALCLQTEGTRASRRRGHSTYPGDTSWEAADGAGDKNPLFPPLDRRQHVRRKAVW